MPPIYNDTGSLEYISEMSHDMNMTMLVSQVHNVRTFEIIWLNTPP